MSLPPDPDALRIGTAEREEAMRVLSEHFAEGRLTTDEYESRVSVSLGAETRAHLRPLFEDLPAPRPTCLLLPPVPYPPYDHPYAAPIGYLRPQSPYLVPSPKSKVLAGVLQIVFPFGVGRFYTGHVGLALAQLFVTLFTFGIGAIWPLIDGILLLINGGTDSYGRTLRD
jgi:hypothetical protein